MAVKPKKIRIKKVSRVALVDDGANLVPGLFKHAEGEAAQLAPLMKGRADEEGILYGIGFAPMMVDGHGHYMDRDGCKAACHSFGAAGMTLDVMHGDDVLEKSKAAVVENTILQQRDERFPTQDHLGREINHEGAWAIAVQLFDEDLLKQAREGTLAELSLTSPAGGYEFEEPTSEELALLKSQSTTEAKEAAEDNTTMTDTTQNEEIVTLLKGLTEAVAGLSEKITKTDEKPEDKPVEKKLDVSNPAELRKHRLAAATADLQKEFGIEDGDIATLSLEELDEYTESLEKLQEEFGVKKARSARTEIKKRRAVEQTDDEDKSFADQVSALMKGASEKHKTLNDRRMGRVKN